MNAFTPRRLLGLTATLCLLASMASLAPAASAQDAQNTQNTPAPQDPATNAASPTPAQREQAKAEAVENFTAGMEAFEAGDCQTAIPRLSNAVDGNTDTDTLIFVTQALSACLASTGGIERARVLMRQLEPLIIAEKGQGSAELLDHNLTWAEFEVGVGQNINAANRITKGLIAYLSASEISAAETFRALAAYSAVMTAEREVAKFQQDLQTIVSQNDQINWIGNQSLVDLLTDLPPIDGTPTSLALWSFTAMSATDGVETFQDLLKRIIQGG